MASIYGSTHLGGTRMGSQAAQGDVCPQTAMGVAGPLGHLTVTAADLRFRKQPTSNIPAFAAEQHREASG